MMECIKINTSTQFALPRIFKLDDGSTITNFHKLTDEERINLAGVFPVVEAQTLSKWQARHTPVYVFSATKATVTYTVTDMPLADYKKQEVDRVYKAANKALDALVAGYSQLEVATWPAIQADILAYDATGTVGAAMQGAIDSSGYDAADLAALILPRIQQQADIYVDRKAQVVAIMAAATHAEV